MILSFPDPDTLRLAITSGVVPLAVTLAPAAAGDDGGRLLVKPSVSVPGEVLEGLNRLGNVLLLEENTTGRWTTSTKPSPCAGPFTPGTGTLPGTPTSPQA